MLVFIFPINFTTSDLRQFPTSKMAASIADIPTTLECLDSRLKELEFLCEGILPPSKPASSIPMQDTVIHDVKTLHSQTNALINQHELLYNLIQSLNGMTKERDFVLYGLS